MGRPAGELGPNLLAAAVQCSVKRLALCSPKGMKFLFDPHPNSEEAPVIFVKSMHPVERRLMIDCRNIDQIYKFLRVQAMSVQMRQ
jgi:hypothetical protein